MTPRIVDTNLSPAYARSLPSCDRRQDISRPDRRDALVAALRVVLAAEDYMRY